MPCFLVSVSRFTINHTVTTQIRTGVQIIAMLDLGLSTLVSHFNAFGMETAKFASNKELLQCAVFLLVSAGLQDSLLNFRVVVRLLNFEPQNIYI